MKQWTTIRIDEPTSKLLSKVHSQFNANHSGYTSKGILIQYLATAWLERQSQITARIPDDLRNENQNQVQA